jgi:catechol 2,3-dioxygenase-like lactoylglutathione lyase family enzyme
MTFQVTDGVRRLLTCTTHFDEAVAFFRDVMGLSVTEAGVPATDTQFTRYALLKMPNDVVLEIVEPAALVRDLYNAPIVSITVDDVAKARREMESLGVAFVAPIFETTEGWGWTYFRAPDGSVYQIQGPYRGTA